jgi:hypothetical protein
MKQETRLRLKQIRNKAQAQRLKAQRLRNETRLKRQRQGNKK